MIRTLFALTLLLAGCTSSPVEGRAPTQGSTAAAGHTERFTFDENTDVPAAFDGTWTVRPENGTNALCQTGDATFPAIALTTGNYRDGVVTVRFNPISGKEDQAAGIIFRVVDKDNYYILRANALEGNVNFYTYVDGKRSSIKESSVPVAAGSWHELRLEVDGSTMTSYLDGTRLVTATDSTFTAGRVGLWTKADSQTCFDDLTITAR
ncbi:LamG-like jellyroll fold domain-containing protein [Lentzea sp. NPDC054927]